jgi:hypothetical protein
MSDIAANYNLSYKDGLYYKKDGTPYAKSNHCNVPKGKLQGDGYKVTVVQVEGGYALRAMSLGNQGNIENTSKADRPTPEVAQAAPQKPVEGKEKSLDDLRAEIEELMERKKLEAELAKLRGEPVERPDGNKPANRPKRKRLGKHDVLEFPESPGYVRRVVNVKEGSSRFQQFLDADWEVDPEHNVRVESDGDVNRPSQLGSALSRYVGTDERGKAIHGVLMRKRKDLYDADQADKQAEQDERIKQLAAPPADSGLRMLKNQQSALVATGQEAEADKRI